MQTLLIGLTIGFVYTFCAFSSILMAIRVSLRYGGVSGFIAGLGHATAQIVWIIVAISVASLGVAALKIDLSHYRFIAAAILFLFGVKFLVSKPKKTPEVTPEKLKSHLNGYLAVFTVAISTPHRIIGYLVLFMLMGASLIITSNLLTKEILVLSTLLGIILWWVLFSIVMSRIKIASTEKIQWILQKIIACIFIASAIIFCLYPV